MSTVHMVELCVHMCCSGCEAKVRKALLRVKGVDSVEIDFAMQKVTVIGWADQKKILKAAKKTGRKVVLWPYASAGEYGHHPAINAHYSQAAYGQSGSYYMQHPALMQQPTSTHGAATSSYPSHKHGYHGDSRGHGRLWRGWSNNYGEKARSIFSDDNPHACSIM